MADNGYRVQIDPRAWREIHDLSEKLRDKIFDAIYELENEPRPASVKKLKDESGLYRIRVQDYRIVYRIEDNIVTVTVVKVAHRKEVYQEK